MTDPSRYWFSTGREEEEQGRKEGGRGQCNVKNCGRRSIASSSLQRMSRQGAQFPACRSQNELHRLDRYLSLLPDGAIIAPGESRAFGQGSRICHRAAAIEKERGKTARIEGFIPGSVAALQLVDATSNSNGKTPLRCGSSSQSFIGLSTNLQTQSKISRLSVNQIASFPALALACHATPCHSSVCEWINVP